MLPRLARTALLVAGGEARACSERWASCCCEATLLGWICRHARFPTQNSATIQSAMQPGHRLSQSPTEAAPLSYSRHCEVTCVHAASSYVRWHHAYSLQCRACTDAPLCPYVVAILLNSVACHGPFTGSSISPLAVQCRGFDAVHFSTNEPPPAQTASLPHWSPSGRAFPLQLVQASSQIAVSKQLHPWQLRLLALEGALGMKG